MDAELRAKLEHILGLLTAFVLAEYGTDERERYANGARELLIELLDDDDESEEGRV